MKTFKFYPRSIMIVINLPFEKLFKRWSDYSTTADNTMATNLHISQIASNYTIGLYYCLWKNNHQFWIDQTLKHHWKNFHSPFHEAWCFGSHTEQTSGILYCQMLSRCNLKSCKTHLSTPSLVVDNIDCKMKSLQWTFNLKKLLLKHNITSHTTASPSAGSICLHSLINVLCSSPVGAIFEYWLILSDLNQFLVNLWVILCNQMIKWKKSFMMK